MQRKLLLLKALTLNLMLLAVMLLFYRAPPSPFLHWRSPGRVPGVPNYETVAQRSSFCEVCSEKHEPGSCVPDRVRRRSIEVPDPADVAERRSCVLVSEAMLHVDQRNTRLAGLGRGSRVCQRQLGGSTWRQPKLPGHESSTFGSRTVPSRSHMSTITVGLPWYGGLPGSSPEVWPPMEITSAIVFPQEFRWTKKPAR